MPSSLRWAVVLSLLLSLLAVPVLAAEPGGGDIHFGDFTLAAGDSVSGDQMVFGTATLERGSTLNGELVVFGALTMKEDAVVNGTVFVAGAADVAGRITGDLESTGPVTLRSTAVIAGDVASAGPLTREDGAVVQGEIQEGQGPSGFTWKWSPNWPKRERPAQPLWLTWLWKIARAVLALLVFSLLALLVSAVWPEHLARMAETVAEQPVASFGTGVLTLLATLGVGTVLLVTICLSPLALLGFFVLMLALGVGWIVLGHVLGMRLWRALAASATPSPLGATVLGTFLLTLLAALLNLVGFCLYAPFAYGLASVGLGALVLTRVGTRPYQSRGTGYVPPAPLPTAPLPPGPPVPPVEVPPVDVPPANPGA